MSDVAPVVDPPVADPNAPPADPPVADPPVTVVPPTDPPADPPPSNWLEEVPDGWRDDLALKADGTTDDARLNHLKRVGGIPALVDNYFAGREMISKGQIEAAKEPDEHSSDEDWVQFRTDKGIPTTAEDYEVTMDEGLVLGDEDKEVLATVFPVAHQLNLSSDVVSKLTNAMIDGQAQQFHKEEIQQEQFRKEADTQVKSAWKGEYETNLSLLKASILGSLPETVRDLFAHAVLADGRKVFNSPEMLIAMVDWARKLNPSATVVPNSANPMKAINDEIQELEARMGTADWFTDHEAQDRYMKLVEARDNLKAQE